MAETWVTLNTESTIRQAVARAIANQAQTSRIPVHVAEELARRSRTDHLSGQEGEHGPVPRQDGGVERLLESASQAKQPISLDQAAGEGDDLGLAEVLEDPHAIAPADAAEYLVLRDRLDALLDELPARERRIIELRFGLLDGHAWTLREVGKVMGLTRERVRQVEILVLKQLRQSTGMGQLRVYLA